MNENLIVSLKDIVVDFDGQKVLDGLSLDIHDKEFVTFLGPSGCGKTTTLRMIAGLETPTSGRITIGDQVVFDSAMGINVPANKRRVGFLFQNYALFPNMTVEENILTGLKAGKRYGEAQQKKRVSEMIERFRLSGLEKRYPAQLSGGQKRRVAIAGVLAMEPDILVLDEPTAGLDPKGRDEILGQISHLQKETGISVVLVSHSMEDVANYVERIIVMNKGKVMFDDVPHRVFSHVKELEAVGLAAPQVTYILHQLKDNGFDVDPSATTIEEAKETILQAVRKNSK
mgnify:CR=1 FL=1